jgi:hypothetical protein
MLCCYVMLLCYVVMLCYVIMLAKCRTEQKESLYVKFQLVPLRATSLGLQWLHNGKKTTKEALCHGTRIVARSSVLSILRPIRFYDNEMQDTKQMFPFSL